MCFFHKWTKWSEIKEEKWKYLKDGKEIRYIKEVQTRCCEKCNKIEVNYLD